MTSPSQPSAATLLQRALRSLGAEAPLPEAPLTNELRTGLSDGERALFDRGVELKRDFAELNTRVLRSARFAEASLGTAAFIHELRQCLSPIIGLAELMKESPASTFVPEWVQEIATQAGRLADLLDRHAALLRSGSSEAEEVDLAELCQEAARYFTRLPPSVKLVVEVPADLPKPMAKRRQLLHALINLLANARDAHKGRAGRIRLAARMVPSAVELLVTDQGSGIEAGTRARLFEPLFTTKAEEGTGLGLYLSRELLRPDADLTLLAPEQTPPDAKTAFAIRLPLTSAAPVEEPAPVAEQPGQGPEHARSADPVVAARRQAYDRVAPLWAEEKNHPVLLVEDEPAVRRMTRAVLESVSAAKIYEAADAAFALGMLEKIQVDFLVCDKNLPDQDGLEVIRRARERHPGIDAMIVTGYPSPESAAEAIRVGATDYLLKPVREVKTLRESVLAALLRQRLARSCTRHEAVYRELSHALSLEGGRRQADGDLRRSAEELSAQLSPAIRQAPLRVAVLGGRDQEALGRLLPSELERLETPASLEAVEVDLDLVVFSAETSADQVRALVSATRGRPGAPHLVAVGEFLSTESAVAAIQGRTGFLVAREQLGDARKVLEQAAERRRTEARGEALLRFLRALGIHG